MANDYVVKVTDQAAEQLQEITYYIAYNLQAPDSARRLLDALESEIASLSEMPSRIALMQDEPWHSHGIHRMPVGSFLVYFWIDEAAMRVLVTAVIYGKRDQVQQLHNMNI